MGVSGNSEMFYIGPSFTAGVQKSLGKKQKWQWVPEVHYFQKRITEVISPSETEKFRFLSYSIRSNFNYFFGKKSGRGFFIGAGIGYQFASDQSEIIKDNGQQKETIPGEYVYEYSRLMPSFNLGQSFGLNKGRSLQVLLSAIGPYHEDHNGWSCTEIISVLSLNVRVGL
jgi:glycosyltransferase involved in cell wall biosynthesis